MKKKKKEITIKLNLPEKCENCPDLAECIEEELSGREQGEDED